MNLQWIEMSPEQFTRKAHSYMLTSSLWKNAPTSGCQCQNVFAILVENGEMVDWDQQSDYPVHISKKTEEWLRNILIKVGDEWITRSPEEFNTQSEEVSNVSQVCGSEYVDVNGEPREAHPCFDYDEHNWEDDVTEEKLPDGIYMVMLQTHCWSEVPFGYSYPEGDSEHEVALIKSVPIDFKGYFNGGIQREVDMEGVSV